MRLACVTLVQVLHNFLLIISGQLSNLWAQQKTDLQSIQGIGPQIAESVVRFFADKHNRRIVDRLKMAGVQMADYEKACSYFSTILR